MGFLGSGYGAGLGQGLNNATDNLVRLYMFGQEQKQKQLDRKQQLDYQNAQIANIASEQAFREQATQKAYDESIDEAARKAAISKLLTPPSRLSEDQAIAQTAFEPGMLTQVSPYAQGGKNYFPGGDFSLPDTTPQMQNVITPEGYNKINGLMQTKTSDLSYNDLLRTSIQHGDSKDVISLLRQLESMEALKATLESNIEKIELIYGGKQDLQVQQQKHDMEKQLNAINANAANVQAKISGYLEGIGQKEAGKDRRFDNRTTAQKNFDSRYQDYLTQFNADEAAGKYTAANGFPNGATPLSRDKYFNYEVTQAQNRKKDLKQTPSGSNRKDLKSMADDIVNKNIGIPAPPSTRQTGTFNGIRSYSDDGGKTVYDIKTGKRLK